MRRQGLFPTNRQSSVGLRVERLLLDGRMMFRWFAILLASSLAVACFGEIPTQEFYDEDNRAQAESQGPTTLSLFLTDAPAEYEAVWVTVGPIAAQAEGSWLVLSEQIARVNLLELQDGVLENLGNVEVSVGHIDRLHLMVQTAEVVVGGEMHPATISLNGQLGVEVPMNARLAAGSDYELVLDFDAKKSLTKTGSGYVMTPAVDVKRFEAVPPQAPGKGAAGAGGMVPSAGE